LYPACFRTPHNICACEMTDAQVGKQTSQM
jgi:hypothetical protein